MALGSVTNVEEAVKWLSYTYLYVRMRANPLVYGISHKVYQVGLNVSQPPSRCFGWSSLSVLFADGPRLGALQEGAGGGGRPEAGQGPHDPLRGAHRLPGVH